jgi:hypothetical protein
MPTGTTLAYSLSPHDDGSYMLGGGTYRPAIGTPFHDWRFGVDGVPHPATCGMCGRKTDPKYVNPNFRVKKRNRDTTCTYDGYILVSNQFRDFCFEHEFPGLEFTPLPADPAFLVFRQLRRLRFDDERRGTRFAKPCPDCGAFYEVIGARPVYLCGVDSPIEDGIYRSDLEFGSGPSQHPLIFVGVATVDLLRARDFTEFHLDPVVA